MIQKILKGDVRAASKLLTLIENRDPAARPFLKALYPHTGKARLVGITGPAGAGKSTLINHFIAAFRKKKKSVGVLAIDPTSPFSGGAVLGDRLRLRDHFLDKGVFIRSLTTRGAWGGIGAALFDAVHLLDAMGKEIILIETVGAGQDEVQIARLAEVVIVVLSPGAGDEVQLLKAGLLEIGDLLVVNKGELPEAKLLHQQLQEAAQDRPVLLVSAFKERGVAPLIAEIDQRAFGDASFLIKDRKKNFTKEELQSRAREALFEEILSAPFDDAEIEAVRRRTRDPDTAVRSWMRRRTAKHFS